MLQTEYRNIFFKGAMIRTSKATIQIGFLEILFEKQRNSFRIMGQCPRFICYCGTSAKDRKKPTVSNQ